MADRLIKLGDGCHVMASHIIEVTVNNHADYITVRTKDGIGHSVGAIYGKGIYATRDLLINEINAALEGS